MRRPFVISVLSATLLTEMAAHAQQPPAPSAGLDGNASAEADRYFQLGKEASKARNLHEAYENYRRAWELKQSPDIACNLGNVELELSKHRDAVEHLTYCVKNYPPSGTAEGKTYALQRLEKVRGEVASVSISVNVPDATVFLDGKRIGRTPLLSDVFVEPGRHTVEVKLTGYDDASAVVEATKGGKHEVRLQLVSRAEVGAGLGAGGAGAAGGDEGGGAGGDSTGNGGSGSKKSVPLVVAGLGIGALGLGLGIGFLVASSSASSDADDLLAQVDPNETKYECTSGTVPLSPKCREIDSARSDASTFGTLSAVAFVTGGVALAATAAYLLLPSSGSATSTGAKKTVQAAPLVGPRAAGAVFTGSF